ncbi:MAG: hypothetical protein M0Q53_08415 [Prolixibacteraceae bacterium]|jgi:hypothetical protein|nr:hypothetical protein [Prolixibacteraceae bacterium]
MMTRLIYIFALALLPLVTSAQWLDFSKSSIICSDKKNIQLYMAATVLQEELQLHTSIKLAIAGKPYANDSPQILFCLEKDVMKLPAGIATSLNSLPPTGKDGYKIALIDAKTVVIAGHDERGALYGAGYLMRKMELSTSKILLPDHLSLSSTPTYPIRGHQLGYRPKTNAYDAWSVAQYDRYIRDLALFGANSIEIMPPRTDDDATSVHMKLPAIQMIVEQARICKSYGLDVWIWYPNMGSNYNSPDSIKAGLAEREKIFSILPKLDALFVPGGDPGDLEPDPLFSWLNKEAVVLKKYHPNAKIWVSPQAFKPSTVWYASFFAHINMKLDWLGGVVYGPWIKMPLPEVRRVTDPSIPIRLYPDITHSYSCQYPVPQWDLAFAMTLGRECINPRPVDEKLIHNRYASLAQGSISYSEGTNDDVNKFIWTGQDWNPETPVIETLRDYARYFIGPRYADAVAQGLMALEQNFRGPLLSNEQVERTLQQWQDMERSASPEVLANPRFQSGLIRAYYDAYIQRRLIYETDLERQARSILEAAKPNETLNAISDARATLLQAKEKPISQPWKIRCFALADSLFRSFGAQLTIEKHHAMSGRGNFIDNIDIPLNDALWLLDQLNRIEKKGDEKDRQAEIGRMLHRTDPGPGGFYDNLGNPAAWEHVKSQRSWLEDPGSLESPRVSFGVGLQGVDWVDEIVAKGFAGQTTPLAWMNQINTLYFTPLVMEYNNLNPSGNYTLRVAYTGRFRSRMKLEANGLLIHDFIRMGTQPIFEFQLPKEVTQSGKVTFTWSCAQNDKGEGERGSQVAEVWLIRSNETEKR